MKVVLDFSNIRYSFSASDVLFNMVHVSKKDSETMLFLMGGNMHYCREVLIYENLDTFYKEKVLDKFYMLFWHRTLDLNLVNYFCRLKGWKEISIINIDKILFHPSYSESRINSREYIHLIEIDGRWMLSSILLSLVIFLIRFGTKYPPIKQIITPEGLAHYLDRIDKEEDFDDELSYIENTTLLLTNLEYILFNNKECTPINIFNEEDVDMDYIHERGGSDCLFDGDSCYNKIQERYYKIKRGEKVK